MEQKTKPVFRVSSLEYSRVAMNGFGSPGLASEKPRVLLHACCGPCATSCVERLVSDYSVTVFYYNPNITDEKEYFLRRDNLTYFIDAFNRSRPEDPPVSYLEGTYDPDHYLRRTAALAEEPEGGRRCTVCFEMRLAETARVAKDLGFDCFTTTLTVSPHKNYSLIASIGGSLSERFGTEFLAIDFKKKDGFRRSIELSKQYGLYRQNFCGCEYARYR